MQRVVILWVLSGMVLASGALLVCGDDRYFVTQFDRVGLGAAHDLRNRSLDYLMAGVTWLGSLMLLMPLTALGAWYLFMKGLRRESVFITLALLGALYSFTINGADQIMTPFLNETFGVNELAAGLYVSVWGVGVVVGGITGGRLIDRLGVRRATLVAALLALAAIGSLALITGAGVAWVLVPAFGLAYGFYETVYFATSMQRADRRIAASMFSILMAIANIGTGIGLGVTGVLVDSHDYRITFGILAALNLLALPLIPAIFPHSKSLGENH